MSVPSPNKLKPLTHILTDVTLREGSQQELDLRNAALTHKRRLLLALSRTGIRKIEFTAFAPGQWFADAAELASDLGDVPEEVALRALYFNSKGLTSLLSHPRLLREGIFHTAATGKYREANYKQISEDSVLEKLRALLSAFVEHGLSFDTLAISTAWGEKGEMPAPEQVLAFCSRIFNEAQRFSLPVKSITLADTVGNASPQAISQLLLLFKLTWPDKILRAHLHPPQDRALECVEAALDGGADEWEAAWGGVGGSPFAEKPGGNLDVRWLIKVWEKRGAAHGLELNAAKDVIKILQALCAREIPAEV